MRLYTLNSSRAWVLCLFLALAGSAAAQLGSSGDTAACCQLTTSLAHEMTEGTDQKGDETFFAQEGAPPNVHFLIDTSGSMMELAYVKGSQHRAFWNGVTAGCTSAQIDPILLAKGWNAATTYPNPDPGTGGSDTGAGFVSTGVYEYGLWADNAFPTPQHSSAANACANIHSSDSTKRNACITCLNTKGYYRNPDYAVPTSTDFDDLLMYPSYYVASRKHFLLTGNVLNFHPPKYITLRAVLKSVISDLRRVRMGYSTFDTTGNSNGASMGRGQNPSCSQILKDGSSFDSNRASYISAVNAMRMTGGTPLAESVFNIGQYFSSSDDIYTNKFGFDTDYLKSEFRNGSLKSESRSWCWGCQVSSVVILTDGDPTGDASLVAPLSSSWDPPFPKILAANGKNITCPADDPCPDTNLWKLDDVTYFLHRQDLQQAVPVVQGDLNTAGRQSLVFYGIGFGVSSALLRNAVREEIGGGFYREAWDVQQLKAAILEIISHIERRATSFSASSVSSLQINKTGSSILPRFKPANSDNKPWQGYLYRFDLGREALDGCKEDLAAQAADAGTEYALDRNGDGSCDDFNLVDKNGRMTLENDDGDFVLYDAPTTPATPYWEAGEVLRNGSARPYVWKSRSIWTIIDNSTGSAASDKKYDVNDTPIEFSEANASVLRPYLGIGNDPMDCADVATMLDPLDLDGMDPTECAKTIIRWVRGADAFSPNLTLRDKDRAFLLHDIFHSSPVTVHAPVPAGFELLTQHQQLQTLSETGYRDATNGYTPFQQDYVVGSRKMDAWEAYLNDNQQRDELILIGSNGGMLHAFHGGSVDPGDPYDATTGTYKHDVGTGEELWAFIPPDLLPRLRKNLSRHSYMVDGSAMVRDVWLDTNDDNIKQKEEFRTVVVMNEGFGGVHRFALDLTKLIPQGRTYSRTGARFQKGDFLWLWPQPCDPMALKVGRSISEFLPRPPPIGPIRVLDEAGVPGPIHGDAEERWVAFLNGGYDQYLTRGQGVAMVDVRTGSTLWTFWNGDGGRADDFKYPTTAAVGMVDIGDPATDSSEQDDDLFFDTANIGDYGGTLWTFRFYEPAKLKTVAGGGLTLDNPSWFGARAMRAVASPSVDMGQPFGFMVEHGLQFDPLRLRVFTGTGNRMHLLDIGGPRCRTSNPLACAQLGCVVRNTTSITRNGTEVSTGTKEFSNYTLTSSAATTASTGTNACLSSKAKVTWDYDSANGCTNDNAGDVEMTCSFVAGQGFQCRETSLTGWDTVQAVKTAPTVSPHRFYGVYVYGGDADRRFATETQANAYHAAYLTEGSSKVIRIDDVTKKYASAFDYGWYWPYADAEERTGNLPTLVGNSIFWNSFIPSGSATVCSTVGTNQARIFQADFITGSKDSAEGFYDPTTKAFIRSKTFATVAIPPPPTSVWSIDGAYSSTDIMLTGPGVTEAHNVKSSTELYQSVYQLEMDRTEHQCRHEQDPGACR